jgi:hypothetical protein
MGARLEGINAQILAGSQGYADYAARIADANAQMGFIGPRVDQLSQGQYAYAQALIATGTSERDAIAAAQARGESLNQLNAFITTASLAENNYHDILGDLGPTMIGIAAASDTQTQAMLAAVASYNSGDLSAAALRDRVLELDAALQAEAEAAASAAAQTDVATAATVSAAAAANEAAIAKAADAVQAEILAIKNDELNAAILAAANGSATAENAAATLAAQYSGVSVPALIELIGLLREKAALENVPAGGAAASVAEGAAGGARSAGQEIQRENAEALAAAQARYTSATETSAQRVARLRAELGQLRQGTAAYVEKQTELYQAEQRLNGERTSGASRAAAANRTADAAEKGVDAVAKAARQEYEARRDAAQKIENIERDHYDKLKRMSEDYELSQSRSEEDYQRQRQRLLAEGKVKEAQLLEEEFKLSQKRAAEDRAVAVRRENEGAGKSIAETAAKAAQDAQDRAAGRDAPVSEAAIAAEAAARRTVIPPGATAAPAAQAAATLAATAALQPRALEVRVSIAPTAVQIDGGRIVDIIWPEVSERIDADLAGGILNLQLTAPPTVATGGVGGPSV